MLDELLREDLADLREALEAVEGAIATGDPETVALAKTDALALVESVAVLHCHIVEHVLADRKAINRKIGCREVLVPLDFEGLYFVAKPRKVELPK